MAKKSAKNKKVKINTQPPKATIQELQTSRDGGQVALRGFTYQFLYSCYLILSESDYNTVFHLEGIEDIDQIKHGNSSKNITHVQLKYSTLKQDASFLKDILTTFLEAYLLDNTRSFKLVYDFTVAKGNMTKLFDNNLDKISTSYWAGITEQIKTENPLWNWIGFSFESFISRLTFEKKEKDTLVEEIEKKLIETYDITTGNVVLFANGIKICCLEKMERRDSLNKHEIDIVIQNIKDDINKGVQNPAHNWIKKITFDNATTDLNDSYFEGKKPTPHDIACQLPVRRLKLEQEINESIQQNRVTVIKASSGQGKTTLALQAACNLKNEYEIYQLLWCNDSRELGNIVQFFSSRVKLGEKPLILIDNLDSQLAEWNRLAQLLQEEVSYHYKLLLTTREDDWYSYGGNLSNVKSLNVVKLSLNEEEAQGIYEVLVKVQKIHPSISDWRKSWTKVAKQKLLIEYMYLLTHGEMLSERIAHQIFQINNTDTGKIKCEILRIVCFADICGIKLPVNKLIANLSETSSRDYGELLKSIENEFLIRVDMAEKYVEGLHPVRSQHIVEKLHEFVDIDETALQIVQISDTSYFSKLFSNLPKVVLNKSVFYSKIADSLWNRNDLSHYVLALQGVFSGSVMQYLLCNQHNYDDANEHGGLFIFDMALNPFTRFEEFDHSLNTLDDLRRTMPDNINIQCLCNLRDTTPKIVLPQTDIYYFCASLFEKLKDHDLFDITTDVVSYSSIIYWLINIDPSFNLSKNVSLEKIWSGKDKYSVDVLSSIMYTCFCGNREDYMNHVKANVPSILIYLKASTQSLRVYVSENENEIHVEYILLPSDIRKGNEESVSRLKTICKMLPIFDKYCADSLKPTIEMLSGYKIPDDAHKTMPLRNLFIMFHQEFTSLWSKTIMSNYECDSILEWIDYWFSIRKNIIVLSQKSVACICKQLEGKPLGSLAPEIDSLRIEMNKKLIKEFRFPYEDRPFDEKAKIPEGVSKIKSDYFQSTSNFFDQLASFLLRDSNKARLALINLRATKSSLVKMQKYFENIADEQGILMQQHHEICMLEEQNLQNLMMACLYYDEHQPSQFFNKYQIKSWYKESYKNAMEKAKQALCGLSAGHCIIFPEKYYYDGILSFYPIIVHNLDMTDGTLLIEFFCQCIPFAELDFDYLVVLCRNKQDKIIPSGLRISKDFLKRLKIAIDTEDITLVEQLTPPFPEEVTKQILECFEYQYETFSPIVTGYEGIDRVAELLWAFSKSQEELSDGSDAEYRRHIESDYKAEILNFLRTVESRISETDFSEIFQLCNDVFSGYAFNDVSFNIFYNKLVVKSLEQI